MNRNQKKVKSSKKYNNSKKYYVYAYLDPRKDGSFSYGDYQFEYEPFYIGKGKGYRDKSHLTESSLNNSNNFKNNKIKKILSLKLKPLIIRIESKLTENEALQLEIKLIKIIGRSNINKGPLTNLTDGGDGTSGYKFNDDYVEQKKIKIKQFSLGGDFIKEWDSIKEIKEVIGDCSISDVCNLKRFSLHNYIWRYSIDIENINNLKTFIEEYNNKQFIVRQINGKKNKKRIVEYDIKTKLIKEWDSISESANFYGVSIQAISQAIKYNWPSLNKFWFKIDEYSDDTLQKMISSYNNKKNNVKLKIDKNYKSIKGKKVSQIINNKEIKIWNSMTEASKHLGIPVSNINKVCNKERKRAGGYQWSWVN